jgi:1-acyl-sn-glycerol-3-phosphate acyltransferase
MDVLLIGTFHPNKIHFLAKSVLFGSRVMAAFLRLFGVVPAYRRMDGSDTSKNEESFDRCFEVLARNGVITLFPEGASVTEPKLRAFKTGAARIALGAEKRHDFGLDVHLVPVALGYDEKSVFRSRVMIRVGQPIRIADWQERYEHDPRAAARALTAELQDWFDRVIPQADDWLELRFVRRVRRLYQDELRRRQLADPEVLGPELGVKLDLTRRFHEGYRHYRDAEPSMVESLRRRVDRFYEMLELAGLPPGAFAIDPRGVWRSVGFLVGNLLLLVLGLPAYLIGLLHNYLPYKGVAIVTTVLKPPPEATSAVKLVAGLVLFPLFHLGAAAAYGLFVAPIAAPISLLVTTSSGLLVLSYWHRVVRTGKAVVIHVRNRGRTRAVLERHRQDILDDIERLVREYPPPREPA